MCAVGLLFKISKRNVQSKLYRPISYNGLVLGEVALCVGFERLEAILPNTCYVRCFCITI